MLMKMRTCVMLPFIYALFFIMACTRSQSALKDDGGFPVGYIPDCPGSTDQIEIPEEGLKHILMTVQGPGDFKARQTTYNYHQMKQLAKNSDINFKKQTFVYVIGYFGAPGLSVSRALGKQYSNLGYNVLFLSYVEYTAVYYPVSARYTRAVGKRYAEMLLELEKEGLNLSTVELVGLSLGAQTMSFIAKHFNKMTGRKLPKLVGLDPAGPCYRNLGPEGRLDPSDADFVLVLHTNIFGFGMVTPMGHVDFYINGGELQPAVETWAPCDLNCSHIKSVIFWYISLSHPNSFIGMQCVSVEQAVNRNCYDRVPLVINTMGPNTNRSRKGIFYLSTSNMFPYYLGKKGLKKEYDIFSNLVDLK